MSLRKHLPFFTSTWSLSFDSSVLSNQNSGSLLGAKLDAVSPEMGAAAAGSVAPRRTQFTFVIVIVEPSCLSLYQSGYRDDGDPATQPIRCAASHSHRAVHARRASPDA